LSSSTLKRSDLEATLPIVTPVTEEKLNRPDYSDFAVQRCQPFHGSLHDYFGEIRHFCSGKLLGTLRIDRSRRPPRDGYCPSPLLPSG